MAPSPSTVSFTVRRPTPMSRPSSSGPESDGPFRIPALPRHLTGAGAGVRVGATRTGSPLAGSPRTFSSRENSDDDGEDDDEETGIVFASGSGADDNNDHPRSDSSEEESLVGSSGGGVARHFDSQGQRFRQTRTRKGTFGADTDGALLVIPTRPNPDWREAARRRRAGCSRVAPHPRISRAAPSFVPDSALAVTGADGSVGGLGTRDTINSGAQLSGLQIHKKVKAATTTEGEEDGPATGEDVSVVSVDQSAAEVVEETEDQRALRAILAGEDGSAPVVDIIPVQPLSEADALKQDVQELPDVATADDYERVPIAAFGAAMLRGMGWTDGAVASKTDKRRKNGLTELYLPQARPAMLGIGAKEQDLEDDGSGKKKRKGRDMRYVPVARREDGRDEVGSSRSGTVSRRSSRSPSARREREERGGGEREREAYDERERRRERHRDRDRDEESRRKTEYDEKTRERKNYRDRDRDRDQDWDGERDRARGRSDSYRDREEREGTERRDRDRRDRRDDR